jgi:hypothetical protein
MIEIHPEAAKRANEVLTHLLTDLTSAAPVDASDLRSWMPDLPIQANVTAADLTGPVIGTRADRFGREIERSYAGPDGYLLLTGEPHAKFIAVVRMLHRQATIRDLVSEKTVRKKVFQWLCQAKLASQDQPVVAWLSEELETLIQEIEVIIPIFGLSVETPITVGRVTVAHISSKEIDSWEQASLERRPDQAGDIERLYARLRKKYQGQAAAHFHVRAEVEHARLRAREEAEFSVAALRLLSIGAFAPERPTTIALSGSEVAPRAMDIVLGTQHGITSSESLLYAADSRPWILDREETAHLQSVAGHWSTLLAKAERTSFEEAAFRSMLLYSRATQYRNISEKLIHIFSAIEGLLLRNDNEPINASVADRLAFAVGTNAQERLHVAKTFRQVYAIRSKYVHHARETVPESAELAVLEDFLVHVSQFFMNLRAPMASLRTREEFLDELEMRKYS